MRPDVSCANEGKYEGFFRIPQVTQFLSYGSINLSDTQIAEIPAMFAVGGKLVELLPIYEKIGGKLVAMHNVEQEFANVNNHSYPTIPP